MYAKADGIKAKMFRILFAKCTITDKKKYRKRDDRVFFLSMCCEKDTEFYRSNGEMLSENNRR